MPHAENMLVVSPPAELAKAKRAFTLKGANDVQVRQRGASSSARSFAGKPPFDGVMRRCAASSLCRPVIVLSFLMIAFSARPSQAGGTPFYSGKTLRFIVSTGVGGGTDTISRLVGRFLGQHLAGRPRVVIQNMPGAGGLNATDYLYNLAPHDGSVIGMLDQSVAEAQILHAPGLRADVRRFNWIGRVMTNNAVLIARASAPVKSIRDAFHKTLIVSASGLSSLIRWTVLKRLTGVKFKLIIGHQGSAQAMLAMERGEVDAFSAPWTVFRAQHSDMIRKKQVRILLQTSLDKAPDLPNTPRMVDLAKSAEQRKLLYLFSQPGRVGRSIAAPPGFPSEQVAELRAAFQATMKDPGFLAKAKTLRLDLDPAPGAQLQGIIMKAFDYPPQMLSKARALAKLGQR